MLEKLSADLKTYLENKIIEVKINLNHRGGFNPLFLTASNANIIDETVMDLQTMNKDEISLFMKSKCKEVDIKAAALIFDAYILHTEIDRKIKIPETIAHEKETLESIQIFLYLKDTVFMRSLPYSKNEDGSYWYGDIGWEESLNVRGRFANPFTA